jgi:ABC-type lipoprotein release transport system permease subunit
MLGVVWVYTEPGIEMPEQRIFGFLVFSFYGWIIGSIIGSVLGSISGYFICKALERARPYIRGQAWAVGLVVCTGIWLVIFFAIGRPPLWEAGPGSEPIQPLLLFVVPSIIYIIAGAVLSQYLYSCTVIGRRALRLSRW